MLWQEWKSSEESRKLSLYGFSQVVLEGKQNSISSGFTTFLCIYGNLKTTTKILPFTHYTASFILWVVVACVLPRSTVEMRGPIDIYVCMHIYRCMRVSTTRVVLYPAQSSLYVYMYILGTIGSVPGIAIQKTLVGPEILSPFINDPSSFLLTQPEWCLQLSFFLRMNSHLQSFFFHSVHACGNKPTDFYFSTANECEEIYYIIVFPSSDSSTDEDWFTCVHNSLLLLL